MDIFIFNLFLAIILFIILQVVSTLEGDILMMDKEHWYDFNIFDAVMLTILLIPPAGVVVFFFVAFIAAVYFLVLFPIKLLIKTFRGKNERQSIDSDG